MAEYLFTGQVVPGGIKVNIKASDLPVVDARNAAGTAAEIHLEVLESKITVFCSVNDESHTEELIGWLYGVALEQAKAAIDILVFCTGNHMYVHLEEMTHNGTTVKMRVGTDVAALVTAYSINTEYPAFFATVLGRPLLFKAMSDLNYAIGIPDYAPIGCARAIDAVKHLLSPVITNEKAAWRKFGETLNVSKDYAQYITDRSAQPRHGNRVPLSGPETAELATRAWTIMNRYLEFLKLGGANPLPLGLFPIL